MAPDRDGRAHICLLSTADWNAPLWTNKQYMARELGVAHDVTYVESIGLRRPRASMADARRVAARLRRPSSTARSSEPGVTVVKPRTIPFHHPATRILNEHLLARAVARWIDDPRRKRVLWTYSPLTYGLESHADRVVYHAVDLLGAYPGISTTMIERAERALAVGGAMGIASSAVVGDHLEEMGFTQILVWPNVADVAPFIEQSTLGDHRSRRVVFGGNITPYKVDLNLLERIATEVPDIELVLAGPVDEGGAGTWPDPRRLEEHGVELTGTLSIGELATLYGSASIGVIPYVANEYTSGVNPLKLFEYLAAGLAVVSTPVPSVSGLVDEIGSGDLCVAMGADAFVAAVDALAHQPAVLDVERRTALASAHSWQQRGEAARELIGEMTCNSSA